MENYQVRNLCSQWSPLTFVLPSNCAFIWWCNCRLAGVINVLPIPDLFLFISVCFVLACVVTPIQFTSLLRYLLLLLMLAFGIHFSQCEMPMWNLMQWLRYLHSFYLHYWFGYPKEYLLVHEIDFYLNTTKGNSYFGGIHTTTTTTTEVLFE